MMNWQAHLRKAEQLPSRKDEHMTEFRKGQRVRVELEGEIAAIHEGSGNILLAGQPAIWLNPGSLLNPKVTVTLLEPEGWPPQRGDIWATGDDEWFASLRRGDMILIPDGNKGSVSELALKAMNPRLVRRRGE